jgi:hypothetical protein
LRALCAGSWLRLGCSRLAANQIGDVGVEALARAQTPSFTTLGLSSTCGLGASVLSLSVWARGAVRVACGEWVWRRIAFLATLCAHCALGRSWVRLGCSRLAVCRQPHRRCGCGGAGARTATESDDALSRRYVRPGLSCCRSRSGHTSRAHMYTNRHKHANNEARGHDVPHSRIEPFARSAGCRIVRVNLPMRSLCRESHWHRRRLCAL